MRWRGCGAPHRHRVSVLSPDPDDDRARKRRDPARAGRPPDAFEAAAEAASRAVGLGHRLGHYPGQLSGGEQQRVAIARAFIAGPSCCSPTSRPAISTARPAASSSTACSRNTPGSARTLLLITHDPSIAERCERQLQLEDGRIVGERASAPTRARLRRAERRCDGSGVRRASALARPSSPSIGRRGHFAGLTTSSYALRLARRELRGGVARLPRLSRLPGARGRRDRRDRLAARRGRGRDQGRCARLCSAAMSRRASRYRPASEAERAFLARERHAVRDRHDARDGAHARRRAAQPDRAAGGRCRLSALRRGRAGARRRPRSATRSARRDGVFGAAVDRRRSRAGSVSRLGDRFQHRRCGAAACARLIEREPDAAPGGLVVRPARHHRRARRSPRPV